VPTRDIVTFLRKVKRQKSEVRTAKAGKLVESESFKPALTTRLLNTDSGSTEEEEGPVLK
jgi:hypothetical protein